MTIRLQTTSFNQRDSDPLLPPDEPRSGPSPLHTPPLTTPSVSGRFADVAGKVVRAAQWLNAAAPSKSSGRAATNRQERHRLEEEAAAQREYSFTDLHVPADATAGGGYPPAQPPHMRADRLRLFLFGSAPEGVIDPSSVFSVLWHLIVMSLIALSAFSAPFEAAFSSEGVSVFSVAGSVGPGARSDPSWLSLLRFFRVMQVLTELAFALDIYIKLRTGYEAQGAIVLDRKLIYRHYKKNDLVRDVLAAAPLILAEVPGFRSLFGTSIRLLQLLKLPTAVHSTIRLLEPVADRTGSLFTLLFMLLFGFFLVANALACFWFFTQSRQACVHVGDEIDLSCSWLGSLPDLEPFARGWAHRSFSDPGGFLRDSLHLFAACFYWSSSAGDGFNANTTSERLCAVLGQILVVNGFGAFIVALLVNSLEEFGPASRYSLYRKKVDQVNTYLEKNDFPPDVVKAIRRYYREVWTRQQVDFSDSQLLEELPDHLKREALIHLTRRTLERSDFLSSWLKVHQTDSMPGSLGRRGPPLPSSSSRGGSPFASVALDSADALEAGSGGTLAPAPAGATAGAPAGAEANNNFPCGPGAFGVSKPSPSRRFRLEESMPPIPEVTEEEREAWTVAIASHLKPRSAAPGDVIIQAGDLGYEMFIVKQGKVVIEVDGRPLAFSTSGSCIGEFAILDYVNSGQPHRRNATVKAVTYVELFALHQRDMDAIFKSYPKLKQLMEMVAREKLLTAVSLRAAAVGTQNALEQATGAGGTIGKMASQWAVGLGGSGQGLQGGGTGTGAVPGGIGTGTAATAHVSHPAGSPSPSPIGSGGGLDLGLGGGGTGAPGGHWVPSLSSVRFADEGPLEGAPLVELGTGATPTGSREASQKGGLAL